MALNEETVARIEAILGAADADPKALAGFRHDFPSLSLTRCDLSDVGIEKPFREFPRCNLYLVDATDHCWRLTMDPAHATGLLIAEKPAPGKVQA